MAEFLVMFSLQVTHQWCCELVFLRSALMRFIQRAVGVYFYEVDVCVCVCVLFRWWIIGFIR